MNIPDLIGLVCLSIAIALIAVTWAVLANREPPVGKRKRGEGPDAAEDDPVGVYQRAYQQAEDDLYDALAEKTKWEEEVYRREKRLNTLKGGKR